MFNSTLTPVVAERDQSKIVLYFQRKQIPPTLPKELSEHISADTWASRLPQILRLTARYNHPIPEAAWILIYFILAIVLPTVIDPILIAHFAPDTFAERRTNQSFFTAHVIAMGLFLALTLAFWGPLLAFKALGQQRANVLARRWAAEDARGSKYSGYVPFWQIRLPGVVRNQTRVTINLPSKPQPTLYHPQAYLPSWIGAPASPALEKSPTLDALPMYDDAGRPRSFMFDEKAPAYGAAAYKV